MISEKDLYPENVAKGIIFETDCQINKCSCGKIIAMRHLFELREGQKLSEIPEQEGEDNARHLYFARCDCGNVFVTPL